MTFLTKWKSFWLKFSYKKSSESDSQNKVVPTLASGTTKIRFPLENQKVSRFTPPTHEDGTPYLYEMVCDNGLVRVYGDTPEDLLAFLIEGYQNFTPEEKTMARVRHAMNVKVGLQIRINQYFENETKTETEEIILYNPQKQQPIISRWVSKIPLVLVDAFFEPFKHLKRPQGERNPNDNLWWLTPTKDEFAYLISLHETTFIDLFKRKPKVL